MNNIKEPFVRCGHVHGFCISKDGCVTDFKNASSCPFLKYEYQGVTFNQYLITTGNKKPDELDEFNDW
jgi:hypothetical protein